MPTQLVLDITPAWEYLDGLGAFEIPGDLSEIDVNWVYNKLYDCDQASVSALAGEISYESLLEFAKDLRDIWAEAYAERAYWNRHGRFDQA